MYVFNVRSEPVHPSTEAADVRSAKIRLRWNVVSVAVPTAAPTGKYSDSRRRAFTSVLSDTTLPRTPGANQPKQVSDADTPSTTLIAAGAEPESNTFPLMRL